MLRTFGNVSGLPLGVMSVISISEVAFERFEVDSLVDSAQTWHADTLLASGVRVPANSLFATKPQHLWASPTLFQQDRCHVQAFLFALRRAMKSSVEHRIDADDTARESALHRHGHFGNSLQTSLVEQQCTTSQVRIVGMCASEIQSSGWIPASREKMSDCRKFGIMSAYKYPLDVFNLSVTGWISGFLDWNTSANPDKVSCLLDHYYVI